MSNTHIFYNGQPYEFDFDINENTAEIVILEMVADALSVETETTVTLNGWKAQIHRDTQMVNIVPSATYGG